jgi:hypothetical protein
LGAFGYGFNAINKGVSRIDINAGISVGQGDWGFISHAYKPLQK